MDNSKRQLYLFMILLEFPLVAYLKGSLEVAIPLTIFGIVAYIYLKPFIMLKERVSHFSKYFFGAYFLGMIAGLYKYQFDLNNDAGFGLFLLLNIMLLPFMYKVKKEIELQNKTNCNL